MNEFTNDARRKLKLNWRSKSRLVRPALVILASIFLLIQIPDQAWATTCGKMDRGMGDPQAKYFVPAMISQLQEELKGIDRIKIRHRFQSGEWRIFEVDTHLYDDMFLFYKTDPRRSHYLSTWGGWATPSEELGVRDSILRDVPGIPPTLADCFAWYVAGEGGVNSEGRVPN